MGSKAPQMPPAPDPYRTAAAQTGSNVTSATASAILGNADETSNLGSVKYKVQSYEKVKDPATGKTYSIPKYSRTQTLSPSQQGLYNQQVEAGSLMNNLAINQTKKLTDHLSTPLDASTLPKAMDAPDFSDLSDQSEYRGKIETALNERMNPSLQRSKDALETKLINQGLVRGSSAFNEAMNEAGRQENDARTQILLASGGEARAQGGYEVGLRQGAFDNSMNARNNALQESIALRNQPINEITALLSGGQVTQPQFAQYRGAQVSDTPVGQYIYNSAQMEQQNAQAKAQAAASERAGLYNLVGNVAGAGIYKSDRRLKRDIKRLGRLTMGVPYYSFRYLDDDSICLGVMADEVEVVRPEAVVTMQDGFKAVDYRQVM